MAIPFKFKSVKAVTYYSVLIFIAVLILCYILFENSEISSSLFTVGISIASLLFIWRFGIKFPYIGLVSMERLVQFHLLLTLPIFDVVIINMCAGFIMPFTNKHYRLDSYKVALLRGMSNSAMNVLMMLSACYLLMYYIEIPLINLGLKEFLVIMLVALVVQIINILMIAIYHTADKKNFRKLLNPTLILADLIFVPTGVLSALLFQLPDLNLFWLFVMFVIVILVSFSSLQSSSQLSKTPFLGVDYKSDFLNINSVCYAIMRRINGLFTYDCIYLGSFSKDLQVIELYIKKEKAAASVLPEKILINVSQKHKLYSDLIEVNSFKTAVLSTPFKNQDGNFAFICMIQKASVKYSKADINLLGLLVHRYSMGLSYAITYKNLSEYKNTLESRVNRRTLALEMVNEEKSLLLNELKIQAQRDGLTGLYNRRYFDNIFKNIYSNTPDNLSLAVIDVDFFKKVNDQYGHECGDKVLQQIASILNKNHQHGMKISRYGGEEFVILLRDFDQQTAIDFCHSLIAQIASYQWGVIAINLKLTISIGLSHYPEITIDELFNQADKMLYRAKKSGRNQLQYE